MLSKIFGTYGKSRQFYWWLVSYTIIMLIAMVINMIGYGVTLRVLESEVEKNNQYSIDNLKGVCDSYLSDIKKSAYQVRKSDNLSRLSQPELLNQYEKTEYAGNLYRNISTVNSLQEHNETAVIFRKHDLCVATGLGTSSIKLAYDAYFNSYFDSEDDLLNKIFSVSGERLISVKKLGKQEVVFAVCRIPTINPDIAVVIRIDDEIFSKLLTDMENTEEQCYITDESGNILFKSFSVKSVEHTFPSDKFNGIHYINGTEYMVSSTLSNQSTFRYVKMIPLKAYLEKVRSVKNAFIWGYILCLFVVGGLSYLFAVINDRNKKKLDAELLRQRESLSQSAYKQLLLGKLSFSDMQPSDISRLTGGGNLYVVVTFDLYFSDEITELKDKNIKNFDILCEHFAGEFSSAGSMHAVNFCEINEMCTGVINFASGQMDLPKIKSFCEKICIKSSTEFKIDIHCAISSVVDSAQKLSEAYEQSIEIINFRFLGDGKTVFVYDDIREHSKYDYPLEVEDRIIQFITLSDYETVEKIINKLFDFETNETKMNLSMLHILTADLISTLLKASMQIDKSDILSFKNLYRISAKINNYRQIAEIKSQILECVKKLCVESEQCLLSNGDNKYSAVVEYIEKNYSDPMLNVNMIADVFNINRSWLSENFKKYVGESISNYIVKLRLEKAKELLSTDKTITQIAFETGFSSEVVYYRAFKKYVHITSSQYRQLLKKKNTDS